MKKFIILLMLGVMFGADYPTIPHEFLPKKTIPYNYLNDNYNALLNGITDGTSKVNIGQLYVDDVLVFDTDRSLTVKDLTITGDMLIQGTFTVSGNSNVSTLNASKAVETPTINCDFVDTYVINSNTVNATYINLTGKSSILELGGNLIDFNTDYKIDTDITAYAYYTPSATSNLITMEGKLIGLAYLKDSKENLGANRPTVGLCFPVPANTTFNITVSAVSGSGFSAYKKWGK